MLLKVAFADRPDTMHQRLQRADHHAGKQRGTDSAKGQKNNGQASQMPSHLQDIDLNQGFRYAKVDLANGDRLVAQAHDRHLKVEQGRALSCMQPVHLKILGCEQRSRSGRRKVSRADRRHSGISPDNVVVVEDQCIFNTGCSQGILDR